MDQIRQSNKSMESEKVIKHWNQRNEFIESGKGINGLNQTKE